MKRILVFSIVLGSFLALSASSFASASPANYPNFIDVPAYGVASHGTFTSPVVRVRGGSLTVDVSTTSMPSTVATYGSIQILRSTDNGRNWNPFGPLHDILNANYTNPPDGIYRIRVTNLLPSYVDLEVKLLGHPPFDDFTTRNPIAAHSLYTTGVVKSDGVVELLLPSSVDPNCSFTTQLLQTMNKGKTWTKFGSAKHLSGRTANISGTPWAGYKWYTQGYYESGERAQYRATITSSCKLTAPFYNPKFTLMLETDHAIIF